MVNVRLTMRTAPPSLSFSAVPQEDLNEMVADYLALDGIRVIRRLFVVRFGLLALVAAVGGWLLPGLSLFARWFPGLLFLTPPLWAWIAETRLRLRLFRRKS